MSNGKIGDESIPPFSSAVCTTYHSSFQEDLASYKAANMDGIGLWEYKLPPGDDDELLEQLAASGLTPTFCFPNTPGVIYGDTLFAEPRDRSERTELLKASVRRLARFQPLAIACLAGPLRGVDASTVRSWVVQGLREAAEVAVEVGVPLALEVIRPGPAGSLVSTIPEALDLIGEIGVGNIGVMIDTWHFWDFPQALGDISANIESIVAVQINDRKSDCRGLHDRVLPGDGDIDLPEILKTVREAGYTGFYELEIISDDGTLEDDYPDSLWRADPVELLEAGRAGFEQAWRASTDD